MTINQKIKLNQKNTNKLKKNNSKKVLSALTGRGQGKGIVIKAITMKPKKPNSALRKIVNVKITTSFKTTNLKNQIIKAYVPGIGHNLNQHSIVLIKHGKTQDLPGVKYKVIRGVYDCSSVLNRKSSRSKYGTKKTLTTK